MYTRKCQGNPIDPSLRRTANSAMVISSRYPFVLCPTEASAHGRIGKRAVEPARSSIQLQRGALSLHSSLAFVSTLLQSLSQSSSTHPLDDDPPPVAPSQSMSPVQAPPIEPSHAMSQPSGAIPVASHSVACPEEISDIPGSSHGRSIVKKWPWRKNNKGPALDTPDPPSAKPRDPRPRSHSPARENTTVEGPSTMAAGQRVQVSALP